ncbi:MAG: 6-phosphogluconolactonase [Ferrimicrobium sp.]|jgi:6-phosphogluconolactonase/glucosamine-6-phosphate isomerase/deaminase|uniref:6-phosphogluconolactonase n=1 Tax=Ferrimicrobium acidiphilum TaxID=121039 RepID=A0ABV3Y0T5_9ACTN|nr:6-phosphogluconolactonase [Ferrimicrobium sp.]MCL5972844.1 6-phosphogluconolactonase [Actinomycetota bacterium]
MANFTYEITDDIPERFAVHVNSHLPKGGLLLLSGGHTILELLAALRDSLSAYHGDPLAIGQVDERLVPSDDERSNWYHIANGLKDLEYIDLPMIKCHTPTERALLADCDTPDRSTAEARATLAKGYAKRYEFLLAEYQPWSVVHLGLGADGHTASLFPNSSALGSMSSFVTSNVDPSGANPIERVTLTFPALNRFDFRIIVATGQDKATIVERALHGDGLPIHALDTKNTLLLIDRAAASALEA